MCPKVPVLTILFLHLFSPLLTLCSNAPCPFEYAQSLRLKELVQYVDDHVAEGAADTFFVRPQGYSESRVFDKMCLRYLIGSVAVNNTVSGKALGVICNLGEIGEIIHLPELLRKLASHKDLEAVAQFIAQYISHKTFGPFKTLISDLAQHDWNVVSPLFIKVSDILKSEARSDDYCFLLMFLPIDVRYKMINTSQAPLDMISRIHSFDRSGIHGYSLREIFFMATYSSAHNPEIRSHITRQCQGYFYQLMPKWPPSSSRSCWHEPDWPELRKDTRIHDLFMRDLNYYKLERVGKIVPWSYWLPEEIDVLKFLELCILDGSPFRGQWVGIVAVDGYLGAVMDGRIPLPEMKGCTAVYDQFMTLVKTVCKIADFRRVAFKKPVFLTDEECKMALDDFENKEKWIVVHLPQ